MAGINRTTGKATDLITFSRASGGTFLDSDGLLKTASTNIPRIEYDAAGNVKGLLIEEARTNLITYSSEFDNAVWGKSAAGTGVAPTVTANAALAPDNTMTADRVDFNRGAGNLAGDRSGFSQAPSGITSNTYVGSIWLKAATSGDIGKQIGIRTVLVNSYGVVTLTDDWVRVTRVETGSASNFEIASRGTFTADNQVSVLIWGAQLEAGSFPTSYIPTSGATATRAADIASISVDNFGYNQKAGTVVVEFKAEDTTTKQQYIVGTNTTSARWLYSNSSLADIYNYDGTTTSSVAGWTAGALTKAATSASQSEKYLIVNGSISASSVTNGNITNLTSIIYLGSLQGSGGYLNGHIKSVAYYPRRLSNAQLQALTA